MEKREQRGRMFGGSSCNSRDGRWNVDHQPPPATTACRSLGRKELFNASLMMGVRQPHACAGRRTARHATTSAVQFLGSQLSDNRWLIYFFLPVLHHLSFGTRQEVVYVFPAEDDRMQQQQRCRAYIHARSKDE